MATLSGQTTVGAAGTAVPLYSAGLQVNGPVMVKALTTNTGIMYVGHADDDVDSLTGMPLASGQVIVFARVGNLKEIWVDASVSGEKVAWLSLEL